MITLRVLWHEQVLKHGRMWMEHRHPSERTRAHGVIITCPCGRRWLGRAAWFGERYQ